ncbi:LysE family translocator [Altericroceibacterium spongiae]|uniref:LysE family translocator n=1 Tax=Altericroceibacterium spongiae TaxID=2320269 RepID=A0A420EAB3_9SPHN|nr:LysE family translocator [Altericroceibacterium spongiae]RKF17592.1 LysE family translocator [Altericroceibacterium spongiae]
MDTSLLAPLALYSFVCTATPGPNNIMLASSGLVFGFRRTIPHIFGINFGCALMLVLSGLGLGALFEAWPVLRWAVRIFGAVYLGWLAVKLWQSEGVERRGGAHPLTFWKAAAFQFVNPKAWAITMPAIASFTVSGKPLALQLSVIVAAFVLVGLPSIATWAAMGAGARELLESRKGMIVFVRVMAVLTALTALLFLV